MNPMDIKIDYLFLYTFAMNCCVFSKDQITELLEALYVSMDRRAISVLPKEILNDKECIKTLVGFNAETRTSFNVIDLLPESIQTDMDFMGELVEKKPELFMYIKNKDEQFVRSYYHPIVMFHRDTNEATFEYPDNLKDNLELVKWICKTTFDCYGYSTGDPRYYLRLQKMISQNIINQSKECKGNTFAERIMNIN